MIQIYSPNNTNYEMNGDMTLFPTLCEAISELNGSWILQITHPIDEEGRWKYIESEAVLSVPTFMGKRQLYRIGQITDKNNFDISAKAYPIFFDSADDCYLLDVRPTEKTAQEALDIMMEGSKYSGESNITSLGTAYFVRRNLMNAIGGDSPSFINTWGGEPLYDNYKVILNKRAGGDYGAEVRYGKNMEAITIEEDMSEVATRLVPVAYNGHEHSNIFIDSPLIDKYAKIYIKEITFEDVKLREDAQEDDEENGIIVCEDQEELDIVLEQKCREQFEAGIDLFKVSIDVDVIELEGTEAYANFKDLVKIGLGDTVKCYNSRLDISTEARVVKIVWDCIENKTKSTILGEYQHDFFADMSGEVTNIGKQIKITEQLVNGQKVVVKTFVMTQEVKLTSSPQRIVSFNYAGIENATPIFIATIPLEMECDGNVVFEYRIDGVTVADCTVTKYLETGKHFVTLSNYFTVNKSERATLTVVAYTEYFESNSRKQDAQIASILKYINTGTYAEQAVDTTMPKAKIPAFGIKAVLFAQGLAGTEHWDGTINLTDIVSAFTNKSSATFIKSVTEAVSAVTQYPTSRGFAEVVSAFSVAKSAVFSAPTDRPLFGYVIKSAIRSVDNLAEWTFAEENINTGDGKFALRTLYTYTSAEQAIDSGKMCSVTIKTDDKASIEGVSINGEVLGKYYLICSESAFYTIAEGELFALSETEITSEVFKNYGVIEVPSWDAIGSLKNPQIMYWQEDEESELPVMSVVMTATTNPQILYADPFYMTDVTIFGIDSVSCTYEGSPRIALSFDGGDYEHYENGWVASTETEGMLPDVLTAITSDAWEEKVSGVENIQIRVILNTNTDTLQTIKFDFINEE